MEHIVVPGEAPPERGVDLQPVGSLCAVRGARCDHIDTDPARSWPPLADHINHLARMHVIATVDIDPDPRASTKSTGR
jgi:hypothetical protein